jgi:hypothetical protein
VRILDGEHRLGEAAAGDLGDDDNDGPAVLRQERERPLLLAERLDGDRDLTPERSGACKPA